MSSSAPRRNAIVVGAGPVGCLAALALAKRGWLVHVYEARPDLRLPSSKAVTQQRSINLAISHRGIAAIEAVNEGAAQRFLRNVIPMRGRMIHAADGHSDSQLYDRDQQCIHSIDRALLNEELIQEAASSNIRIFFKHKVISADFDQRTLIIHSIDDNKDLTVNFDLCVGADGSYSIIRRQMMRVVRMNYQQEYIRDEYIELKMPAGLDSEGKRTFVLDPNHLHIWPRHSFMLIALPNKDKTFTCTLFAPSYELERLDGSERILAWFNQYFPDAVKLIGEKKLLTDFAQNPRSPLICTKSAPYHYKDRAILLGDAAHTMVPFYGQGLNCGLEDVRILLTLFLDEEVESVKPPILGDGVDPRLARALKRYSESRHQDLIAICDLAMDNYIEMRHSVTTLTYLFKKTVDNILYTLTSRKPILLDSMVPLLSRVPYPPGEPKGWLPLYTMVTFRPDISYAMAKRKAVWQNNLLGTIGRMGMTLMVVIGVLLVWITWDLMEAYVVRLVNYLIM